jgi:hypothetical protein
VVLGVARFWGLRAGGAGAKMAFEILILPMFLRWLVWAAWKALRFKTWLYPQTALPNPLWTIP